MPASEGSREDLLQFIILVRQGQPFLVEAGRAGALLVAAQLGTPMITLLVPALLENAGE